MCIRDRHPLVEVVSFRGWRSGPGGDALDVQFFGADTDTLKGSAEDLKRALSRYPEVSAVEDNLAFDKEELILDLTAQGQALGFSIDTLGRALRNRLGGMEAATYPDGSRSATIRVELPAGELTADFLERTQMRSRMVSTFRCLTSSVSNAGLGFLQCDGKTVFGSFP